MMRYITLGALAVVGTLAAIALWTADTRARPEDKPRKASGIDKRTLWTTSQVVGSPEPPSPYRLENAFPKVKFDLPLELVPLPGTKRFAVAEQHGSSSPSRTTATPRTSTC